MLAGDQRRPAALQYLQQLSNEPEPGFNAKLRDFSSESARKWESRGSNLSDQQLSLLGADCEGFIHVAYGRHNETLSFYATMDACARSCTALFPIRRRLSKSAKISIIGLN